MLHLEQIEAWGRTFRNIGCKLLGFEQSCCGPAHPCLDELLDDAFGLSEHPEIGVAIDVRA
jgi:hypothetical protein